MDGAGGKSVLADDVAAAARCCRGSIVVSLDEVARAMRLVAERAHVIAEGAAACAVAAALSAGRGARTRKVVAVVSGGNIDLSRFAAARRRVRVHRNSGHPACMTVTPVRFRCPNASRRLAELAIDLWWSWTRDGARSVPAARLRALARDGAQPGADAAATSRRTLLDAGRERPSVPATSTTRHRRARRRARGAQHLVAARSSPDLSGHRSPTSPPSSRCTSRCRSTRAASACSRATTARRPATSACRSSASASCIRRATSTSSVSRRRLAGGELRAAELGRRADRAGDHARRQAVHHRRAARRSQRCSSRSGACGSAA